MAHDLSPVSKPGFILSLSTQQDSHDLTLIAYFQRHSVATVSWSNCADSSFGDGFDLLHYIEAPTRANLKYLQSYHIK